MGEPLKTDLDKIRYYLVLFILIFAVIFRGGNRPIPMMILELASVILLLINFLPTQKFPALPTSLRYALVLLVILPGLYLVPLPMEIWGILPGRELYSQTLISTGQDVFFRGISIFPLRTEIAWLALLPPIAIFLSTLKLNQDQLYVLVLVVLIVAVLQSMLGLLQYGEGTSSALRFGNTHSSQGAEGTYANRNHLAGLLEMVLPISLGLLALSIGHTRSELRYHHTWRTKITFLSGVRMNKAIIFSACAFLILLGLIFTQSRSGIALAMVGILVSSFAYSHRLGGTNVYGIIGTFTAVVIALAVEIGLAPVLGRFSIDHMQNLRFSIYENTLTGIGTFFPLGSGPGTFPFTYPRFQTVNEHGFVNHVHNDYLEWLFEGGMLSAIVMVLIFWSYINRWRFVWVKGYWSTFQFIQVGSGIGIFLFLLHGVTDFNFHIPANAIYFSFLAGLFFYTYKDKNSHFSEEKARDTVNQDLDTNYISKSGNLSSSEGKHSIAVSPAEYGLKPDDIQNPFAEEDKPSDENS